MHKWKMKKIGSMAPERIRSCPESRPKRRDYVHVLPGFIFFLWVCIEVEHHDGVCGKAAHLVMADEEREREPCQY